MNYRMLCRILGSILLILAVLMLLPVITGLIYGEKIVNFLAAMGISAAAGLMLVAIKPRSREIYAREGLVAVGLSWILMSAFGALPFVFSGEIPNFVDAFFETVSGFTTTGASILGNVEALSRSSLFWRSFTHWVGGMGILVFMMAVLPLNGEHSMHIMRAEVPGPTVGKLVPRAGKTALILYGIYAGITAVLVVFLMFGDMSFYDALLHAFATAGTGGFSTKAASIGAFDSAYIEVVLATFMLIFAINFNLYYLLLLGRVKDVLKNEELHWFLGIVAFAVLGIAVNIAESYGSFVTALRHAFFNVATIVSTTGFGTEGFNLWPTFSKLILVLMMVLGAMSGSTGGGMKTSRFVMLIKSARAELNQMASPRSVNPVLLEGRRVDSKTLKAVSTFFAIYIFVLLAGTLVVSADGFDFTTSFTAVLACLSNIGPGLSMVGPTGNYAMFSAFSKLCLSFIMLIGRLEIYPIMILFVSRTWKR